MNEIKELKNQNHKQFTIEITLILIESQKKITISLFISAPITVLKLKEFLSKDFGFDINNMIIFYPIKGIIDNSYILQAKPNDNICLDLIIDDKKADINNLNNEIKIKNNEIIKIKNNNYFDFNLLNNQNNLNYLIKNNSNIKTASPNKKIIDTINDKRECNLFDSKNFCDNKNINAINDKINNNINKNININDNVNIKSKNIKIKSKTSSNQMKSNKCNFVLTKIDDKQKPIDDFLLGKKRSNSKTFKTTLLHQESDDVKSKSSNKGQNKSKYKIVNFSVNKNNKF